MYSAGTALIALIVAFFATSVTINPAQTAETSHVPAIAEIDWTSDADITEEQLAGLTASYTCDYSVDGKAALEAILNAYGQFSRSGDPVERTEAAYKVAADNVAAGTCQWSQAAYVFGEIHNQAGYDFTEVTCSDLSNGLCAAVQPVLERDNETLVPAYMLVTDDEQVENETIGGEQWALIY